ncbi:MAG: hypothetical protein PHE02_02060 [Lachnospiraceae bacterium]|nr:hypothetical protein [Lachnospiraceae bacterium]
MGSIWELEDDLQYDCDITGWLEDYLDDMSEDDEISIWDDDDDLPFN